MLIADVQKGFPCALLIGDANLFGKDVAFVVGIGDGIGRLATVVARSVDEANVAKDAKRGEGA
jgi:hypothetical protein